MAVAVMATQDAECNSARLPVTGTLAQRSHASQEPRRAARYAAPLERSCRLHPVCRMLFSLKCPRRRELCLAWVGTRLANEWAGWEDTMTTRNASGWRMRVFFDEGQTRGPTIVRLVMTTIVLLVMMLSACGDDGGGPGSGTTCADVCDATERLCGSAPTDCESRCASVLSDAARRCVVSAPDCASTGACAGLADVDGGSPSCRCMGSLNGETYDEPCGSTFCLGGIEQRCEDRRLESTSETCGSSECLPLDAEGCDTMSCCQIPGTSETATCTNNRCCILEGPATSSGDCCFVHRDMGDGRQCCLITSGDCP